MTACEEWSGCKDSAGYGMLRVKGKTKRAHRWAYQQHHGLSDQEMPPVVRHTCDNPACVNVAHLEGGTQKENMVDKYTRGRDNHARGGMHGLSKLSEEDVALILDLLGSGVATQKALAKHYQVSCPTINMIKSGKIWKHVNRSIS